MNPEERQKRLRALDKRGAEPDFTSSEAPAASELAEDRAHSGRPTKRLKRIDSKPLSKSVPSGALSTSNKEIISLDSDDDDPELKAAIQLSLQTITTHEASKPHTGHITSGPLTTSPALPGTPRFLQGQVLLTKSDVHVRESHHISIEEIFERKSLRRAVLAAFQVDLEWTLSKLNLGSTAIHIVVGAKDEMTRQSWKNGCKLMPKVLPIFPPMKGVNCMHSK